MLAIIKGGAWECRRPREPFQNSHLLSFSLRIEILQKIIKENAYQAITLLRIWKTG
jgi:hypothetical protein